MTITAKVIADSIAPHGKRIITFQLRYPRFIHAELMTHRVFSRNASSSRAIPVAKLIEDIRRDTAMPIHWGKNQPGMQADEQQDALIYDDGVELTREEAWNTARDRAIEVAEAFDKAGYHKQIVNRLLEPFSHINVLVTATEWSNWYNLRAHRDAQPEIKRLAEAMWSAAAVSIPKHLGYEYNQWHLPYVNLDEDAGGDVVTAIKLSVARCARVSYLTHDGKEPDVKKDLALYERLVGSVPIHASPAEHQAIPLLDDAATSGNFIGWKQYRKDLERELHS